MNSRRVFLKDAVGGISASLIAGTALANGKLRRRKGRGEVCANETITHAVRTLVCNRPCPQSYVGTSNGWLYYLCQCCDHPGMTTVISTQTPYTGLPYNCVNGSCSSRLTGSPLSPAIRGTTYPLASPKDKVGFTVTDQHINGNTAYADKSSNPFKVIAGYRPEEFYTHSKNKPNSGSFYYDSGSGRLDFVVSEVNVVEAANETGMVAVQGVILRIGHPWSKAQPSAKQLYLEQGTANGHYALFRDTKDPSDDAKYYHIHNY